jgi:hypothetical protein
LVKRKKERKKKRGDSSLFKDLLVAAIRHDKIGTPGSLKKKETHFLPCPVVVRRLPPYKENPRHFLLLLSKQLQYFEIYIYRRRERSKFFQGLKSKMATHQ